MKKRPPLRIWLLLGLAPFAILIAGFQLIPVLSMLTTSFMKDGGTGFTLSQYVTALTQPFYLKAIENSLLISLFSSLVGITAGAVIAYSITRLKPATRNRVLLLSNITSNFAGIPLAFAYIILLGNNGVVTLLLKEWGLDIFGGFNLYSWTGLTLVYVYFQMPLAILLLYPSFYAIKDEWKEAASLLGASSASFWRTVGIPCLMPAILGTLGILFANAMGAYATAYALVGGNYNLLAVRISSLVTGDVVTRPELGSALAVLLALTSIAAVWLNSYMTRRIGIDQGSMLKTRSARDKRSTITTTAIGPNHTAGGEPL